MPREVRITTGTRLHWGLLSLAPTTGREFGGIGLMVDAPQFVLSVKESFTGSDRITCSDTYYSKVEEALKGVRKYVPDSSQPRFFALELQSEIPMHCGFGSGTQLSLAVARAVSLLSEEQEPSSVELALRVGRGGRSALGVHGFDRGGFLVEGGKQKAGQISPLVACADFPEDWRILLITPKDQAGISGTVEVEAIQRLGPMPVAITEHLCCLVLMQLLPAVLSHDFTEFSSGLTAFGRTVGEFFKPAQGGIYAHPQMVELETLLIANGIQGIAQTSWGPTLSIVCPSSTESENVSSLLIGKGYGEYCSLDSVNPLNQGAQIYIKESA